MPKFFAGIFLNASVISLLICVCVCSEFAGLFLVLLGQVPLGLIYTCLFDGCGAYCMNNFGSVI